MVLSFFIFLFNTLCQNTKYLHFLFFYFLNDETIHESRKYDIISGEKNVELHVNLWCDLQATQLYFLFLLPGTAGSRARAASKGMAPAAPEAPAVPAPQHWVFPPIIVSEEGLCVFVFKKLFFWLYKFLIRYVMKYVL